MSSKSAVTVRMFGALHTCRKDRGLPSQTEMTVPAEGRSAVDLAQELDLPLEKVEAVFINHHIHSLDHLIMPGDRVAFIPTGIPGPARGLLGIYGAGQGHDA